MQSMQFSVASDQKTLTTQISDILKPESRVGVDRPFVYRANAEDYVVIARVFAPRTRETTILIAGITPVSSHAAGEFLTNPVNIKDFSKTAPADWQKQYGAKLGHQKCQR